MSNCCSVAHRPHTLSPLPPTSSTPKKLFSPHPPSASLLVDKKMAAFQMITTLLLLFLTRHRTHATTSTYTLITRDRWGDSWAGGLLALTNAETNEIVTFTGLDDSCSYNPPYDYSCETTKTITLSCGTITGIIVDGLYPSVYSWTIKNSGGAIVAEVDTGTDSDEFLSPCASCGLGSGSVGVTTDCQGEKLRGTKAGVEPSKLTRRFAHHFAPGGWISIRPDTTPLSSKVGLLLASSLILMDEASWSWWRGGCCRFPAHTSRMF